jgi:hypothetical protein
MQDTGVSRNQLEVNEDDIVMTKESPSILIHYVYKTYISESQYLYPADQNPEAMRRKYAQNQGS